MSSVVEMPCLGRHLLLGMSYDLCTDKHGSRLWDSTTMQSATRIEEHDKQWQCEVENIAAIGNNDILSKGFNISTNCHVQLSVLARLISNISGSAEYYKEKINSTKHCVGVVLRCTSLSRTETLIISNLFSKKDTNPIDSHVVASVTWGLEAFFVFTRDSNNGEIQSAQESLFQKVKHVSSYCNSSNCIDVKDEGELCKFYGDFSLPKKPTTLIDAVAVCKKLHWYGHNSNPVPLRVTLYRIAETCDVCYYVIAETLIDKVKRFMSDWIDIEQSTIVLQQKPLLIKFNSLREQLVEFKDCVTEIRIKFSKSLETLVPKVRSGTVNDSELEHLLDEYSSFQYRDLKQWLSNRTKEINTLNGYVNKLQKIEFFNDETLSELVNGNEYTRIFCFVFNAKRTDEEYLLKMKAKYMNTPYEAKDNVTKSWTDNKELKRKTECALQEFRSLYLHNERNSKYVFTDEISGPGIAKDSPVIIIFEDAGLKIYSSSELQAPQVNVIPENGSYGSLNSIDTSSSQLHKTMLPGKPSRPVLVSSMSDSVRVRWMEPDVNTSSVTRYTVYCHSSSDPSDKWQAYTTDGNEKMLTISNLRSKTNYIFKVCAESKYGSGDESDISEPIFITPVLPGKPGVPIASCISNGISLRWTRPQDNAESTRFYTILYRTIDSEIWEEQHTAEPCELFHLTSILPQKEYIFKVRPECEIGAGPESDPSESLLANIIDQPSKPVPVHVDSDHIQLQWEKPTLYCNKISKYTVFYRSSSDTCNKFTEVQTDGNQQTLKITGLTAKSVYFFKVRAETFRGPGVESEYSDPIRTKPLLPGKPGIPYLSTQNNLELQWKKPDANAEVIKCYTVLYHPVEDSSESWKEESTTDSCESLVLTSLRSGHEYIFKVRSESEIGAGQESDPSEPIYVHTSDQKLTCSHPSECHEDKHWLAQTAVPKIDIISHTTLSSSQLISRMSNSARIKRNLGKPDNIREISVTSNSIHLQWSKPQHDPEQQVRYKILYQISSASIDEFIEEHVQTNTMKATLGGLCANTAYFVKVVAESDDGQRAESEVKPIKTRPLLPGKPSKPSTSILPNNGVRLSWNKPKENAQLAKSYTVFYCPVDQPLNDWKEEVTHSTRLELSNLNPGKRYQFKVRAESETGSGPESDCSDCITIKRPRHLISKPGKPFLKRASHNCVTIEWKKPATNQNYVKGYTTIYRASDDPKDEWREIEFKSPNTSAKIEHLDPKTAYFFKIRPDGYEYSGEVSDVSEVIQTNALLPSKPESLKCFVTGSSVHVQWKEPKFYSHLINYYRVTYKPTKGQEKEKFEDTNGKTESIVLNSLDSEKTYQCRVCAVCDDGEGPCSDLSAGFKVKKVKEVSLNLVEATHNHITLQWSEVGHTVHPLTEDTYTVLYRPSNNEVNKWMRKTVYNPKAFITGLQSGTSYYFKVQTTNRMGSTYDSNQYQFETKKDLPGKPLGRPVICSKTYNSIVLEWKHPTDNLDIIKKYTVFARSLPEAGDEQQDWIEVAVVSGTTASATVKGLSANTQYIFKVRPESKDGSGPESDYSSPCLTSESIANYIASQHETHFIEPGPPEVYQLYTTCSIETPYFSKLNFGYEDPLKHEERVLILVGATGAGKTTLINGFANYILGVRWEDNFRFKLINEVDNRRSQAQSQTQRITAYSFHPMEGSHIPYTLTIIDTPGFGDTLGVERDKELIAQIKHFFSSKGKEGIDQLHSVGFVVPATEIRLTRTQQYIFESIFSLFGNNIKENIVLMTTFSDGNEPHVISSLQHSGITIRDVFKFNNSALFAKQDTEAQSFDKLFWELGQESFVTFFGVLGRATPQSLQLTREVLQERTHFQAVINGLQDQIKVGLSTINELRREESLLREMNAKIAASKDVAVTYEVWVTKVSKVFCGGQFATNCVNCNYTCHYPCQLPVGELKQRCAAMRNGRCRVCPLKCSWEQHSCDNYRLRLSIEKEIRTPEALIERHYTAQQGKFQIEEAITAIKVKIHQQEEKVLNLIQEAHVSLQRLKQIALRPDQVTVVNFIDMLLKQEQGKAEPGYLDRIEELYKIRALASKITVASI